MSFKHRLKRGIVAFVADPDRVVFLDDDRSGDQRVAYMGNTKIVGESDSSNLARLASRVNDPEDQAPGLYDRYPSNDRRN